VRESADDDGMRRGKGKVAHLSRQPASQPAPSMTRFPLVESYRHKKW